MTSRSRSESEVIPAQAGIQVGADTFEVLDLPATATGLPPLLLLHEGLGSVSMWGSFPSVLAQATGARVVAYSRLGFGKSSARSMPYTNRFMHEEAFDTLPPLRRSLGLDRPVLVGHSTGGSMALLHAAHDPAGVAGVVAMAPLLDVEDGNLASIREARRIFEGTAWRQKLARHHDHPIDQVFTAWNDTWLAPGFREWTIVADLATLRCPVLAIVGRDDPYSTPRQLDLLAQGATRAARIERLELAECGHVPYRDHPDTVRDAIAAYVHGLGA